MKINVKKKVVVTGCAGFVGSTLVDKLLELNYHIIGIDNFSTGQKTFLKNAFTNKNFEYITKKLEIKTAKLKKIYTLIDSLNPIPSNGFSKNRTVFKKWLKFS